MFAERTMETGASSGTSTLTLGTSVSGWKTWRSQLADTTVVFYFAEISDGSIWEAGYGTLTYGSPDTITGRALLLSSTGSLVDFASATVYVMSVPNAAAIKHLISGGKATARPAWLQYGPWVDSDTPSSTIVTRQFFDGASDILLGYLDTTLHLNLGLYPPRPQGRLTLTTATPVLTANVLAAATIYYTPHCGSLIPLYNSATGRFHPQVFAEITNDTTASSTGKAGPAAVTTNSNYDLFVWNDAGTIRLTRGPAWTSDTARGTGAGTTQISRVVGIYSNTVAITNGPGAGLGTYVGTIRTNGTSTVDMNMNPAAAAGGSNALLGVYNAYNRVKTVGRSRDTTDSWVFGTAYWTAVNNSNSNRVTWIDGLGESAPEASMCVEVNSSPGTVWAGISFNAVGAPSYAPSRSGSTSTAENLSSSDASVPSLGVGYAQMMHRGDGVNAVTWYGDGFASGVVVMTGITARLEM